MDEECFGGISEIPEQPGSYLGFVVRHTDGTTLATATFTNLFEAIRNMNGIEREWAFAPIGACGGGNCGTGKCGTGGCGKTNNKLEEQSC